MSLPHFEQAVGEEAHVGLWAFTGVVAARLWIIVTVTVAMAAAAGSTAAVASSLSTELSQVIVAKLVLNSDGKAEGTNGSSKNRSHGLRFYLIK